jgi:hypothetical protein
MQKESLPFCGCDWGFRAITGITRGEVVEDRMAITSGTQIYESVTDDEGSGLRNESG